jgi:hypothetical protein
MPSYLGWNVITIPGTPPAPQSIDFYVVDIVSLNRSPFTGQQQIYSWGATYMEATVNLPPLSDTDAQEWLAFLRNLQGVANVFQFTSAFAAAYPESLSAGSSPPGNRHWRLKSNTRKWTISDDRFYRISFDIMEAL